MKLGPSSIFNPRPCNLKRKFQRKLQNSRIPGRRNLPEGRGREIAVWLVEVDIVEQVEELRPELKIRVFSDVGVLDQPKIGVKITGSAQIVFAGTPVSPNGVGCEDGRVEILLDELAMRTTGI